MVGTLVLVFGWMGFNPGSTFGATDLRIGVVAVEHAARRVRGRVMAMAWTNWKYGKPDISMSCNGMLAGLVAITAPCAFVAPWAAVIGVVAGALVCWGVEFFDRRPASTTRAARSRCTACAAHGACSRSASSPTAPTATAGTASPPSGARRQGIFYGDAGQLVAQIIDVVVGFIWAWGVTWLIFRIAKRFMKMRVVARGRDRGSRRGRVRQVCYPDFVIRTETDSGVTHELDEPVGTSASTPVTSDEPVVGGRWR